jgi:hypothetical protein
MGTNWTCLIESLSWTLFWTIVCVFESSNHELSLLALFFGAN